ncbi:sn-glycerol-3-phosphate transmembrane ABC transporter [Legionella birminghamensis]|uniref:sn-glycerol-3-phosphate transport system permease protein UgpA n=1 Tax=Legionella birminghamensis TaxID=28083 RepID=A0A378IIH1_9GAMM|nr:ABC transporter permease subunit [Legionella birminghamensis]KTC69414.1 sn-glycerol-3-phosphate transmembrane ABC transporter [Legionella birminghamensis]STX31974.1 sn-glycerol 3-phosphate transport system permease protein [Legionella birminghamensis]
MANFTSHKKLALLLIAPQLVITLLFFIWPAFMALVQSVYFSDAFGLKQQFAGLSNFVDLLLDPEFTHAILMTIILAFSVAAVTMCMGLFLAYLVSQRSKSQKIYKTLLIWPYAVAPAIAAILWRFLCQPGMGWFSHIMEAVGIHFNYLTHPGQALIVIIIAASWQQFSYNFLFFLAALKAIPHSLIDAAVIDGATSWQRFWQIIFPLLSPTTFFLLVMNLIYGFFETFGIVDILTSGGPGTSTSTLIYKIYRDGFVGMDPGSSASQSVILMLLVVGLTLLQFYYLEKRIHYK